MILILVQLLHLKDLLVKIVFCDLIAFQVIESLHEPLCKRRDLPLGKIIKEVLDIR